MDGTGASDGGAAERRDEAGSLPEKIRKDIPRHDQFTSGGCSDCSTGIDAVSAASESNRNEYDTDAAE